MGISREGMGELKREKQRRQEEEQRRESDRDQELALQQRVDHEVAKRVERALRERSRQAAASESPKRRRLVLVPLENFEQVSDEEEAEEGIGGNRLEMSALERLADPNSSVLQDSAAIAVVNRTKSTYMYVVSSF